MQKKMPWSHNLFCFCLSVSFLFSLQFSVSLRFIADQQKAISVFVEQKGAADLVIGADTIVVLNGKILEKPKDAIDATEMLRALSDNTNVVYSGCALVCHGPKVLCRSEVYESTSDCYNEKALGEDLKAVVHFRDQIFLPKDMLSFFSSICAFLAFEIFFCRNF